MNLDDILSVNQQEGPVATGQKRETFRGIPSYDKSKMWDYALEEDDEGNRILSFLVDDQDVVNFKLNHPKEKGLPILADRLPDLVRDDFGSRGNALRGRFQVHKSGPESVYGTIHGGKNTLTFSLQPSEEDPGRWRITPKKPPFADVHELVELAKRTRSKIASFQIPIPSVETLTSPVVGDYPSVLGKGAIIGAGAMGLRNVFQKLYNKITGRHDTSNNILADLAIGAGGGALVTGGIKMMGENGDPNDVRNNPRLSRHKLRSDELVPVMPRRDKMASMRKTASVDIMRIQNSLAYDQSLTPSDRNILLSQLQQASRRVGNQMDPNTLRRAGFNMLAGYVVAKFLGFGNPVSMGIGAAAAIAPSIFGGQSRSGQKKWDPRGFSYY